MKDTNHLTLVGQKKKFYNWVLIIEMKRKELHQTVDILLEKLAVNNKNLSNVEGRFSQLETDLLRKLCIDLYDTINQMHLANMLETVPKEKSHKVVEPIHTESKEATAEKIIEAPIIETSEIEVVEIPKVLEETIAIDKPEEKPKVIQGEEIINSALFDTPRFVPIVEKEVIPKKEVEEIVKKEPIVNDTNHKKEVSPSIHETVSAKKEEKELSHHFANSKIAKIKDIIDISKRFEIQSNLFGGDSNAYNISLNELENAPDKTSALDLFNRFGVRYHWKHDNELAMELKSFIYRKF